jgi:hypothetical protein
VGDEIRDDDVRTTAPVELPYQGAADKAGAAGYQNAALPPKILIFVDRVHGSNVTRIRRVFHPSARIDRPTGGSVWQNALEVGKCYVA